VQSQRNHIKITWFRSAPATVWTLPGLERLILSVEPGLVFKPRHTTCARCKYAGTGRDEQGPSLLALSYVIALLLRLVRPWLGTIREGEFGEIRRLPLHSMTTVSLQSGQDQTWMCRALDVKST
jgi:hypothetical protein